jgi:protein-S-isoprenylcysteine O-methyltransferase Ste14
MLSTHAITLLGTAAWLLCGIYATIPAYWILVHGWTDRWRTARHKLKVLAPLWMVMWMAAWAVSAPWRGVTLYHRPATWMVAPLLWMVSATLYIRGGRELSLMRVIGRDELEPAGRPPKLITTGAHALVRHPLYLGHICTMLGLCLATRSTACFALWVFALLTGYGMVRLEERELLNRFGQTWLDYKSNTPCILPRWTERRRLPRA